MFWGNRHHMYAFLRVCNPLFSKRTGSPLKADNQLITPSFDHFLPTHRFLPFPLSLETCGSGGAEETPKPLLSR